MNDRNIKPRGWLGSTLILIIIGVALAWMTAERRRSSTQSELLLAQLQTQVKGLEQRVAELKAELEERDRNTMPYTKPTTPVQPQGADQNQLELTIRLAQLATTQSNTLFLVQKLLTNPDRSNEAPAISAETVTVLRTKLAEQERRVGNVTQTMGNLLVNLKIPPEVTQLDPNEVWGNADLRAYWPYYQAERDLEAESFILERLRVRLYQSEIDLATQQANQKK